MSLPLHPRFLCLDDYKPDYRAKVISVDVENVTASPFSQVLNASLTIESGIRALAYWKDDEAPFFNDTHRFRLFNQFLPGQYTKDNDPIAPPGRVLCTLDERPSEVTSPLKSTFRYLTEKAVICLQIARFGHKDWAFIRREKEWIEENINRVFGLLLEPTRGRRGSIGGLGLWRFRVNWLEVGMLGGWLLCKRVGV
jgi:hypothetical protein